jgi:hypothetical protein
MTQQINPGDLFRIGLTSNFNTCIRMFLFSTKEHWGYLHYDLLDNTITIIQRAGNHQPQIKKL